jgi:hypothetical protein
MSWRQSDDWHCWIKVSSTNDDREPETGIDVDSLRAGKAGTRTLILEKLAKKTSAMSAMSESLPRNGSVADIKADRKSEADVSCQPHVSPNVSHETLIQQEIQLSADMTDMADIKKTTNSSTVGRGMS